MIASRSTGEQQGINPTRWERPIVIGMMVIYVLIAIGFSLGPIFEGPDEYQHARFVRFLLANHDLPVLGHDAGWESHQPPVYYAMIAPIRAFLHDDDIREIADRYNPFYSWGNQDFTGNYNKNLYIHTSTENFPYALSPTAYMIHVLRLASVAMGLATMVTCYAIFRELFPDKPDARIFAFGVTAFWPIAVYFAGLVNNDGPVNLFSTISLLLIIWQVKHGPSWIRSALLGAVLGLAILSKVNAAYMALPVGIGVLTDRRLWPGAALTMLITIVISVWWLARNMLLYGEPSGITLFYLQVPAARVEPGTLSLAQWANQMMYSYTISWARFGPETIRIGDVYLRMFDLLVLTAFVGGAVVVFRFVRDHRNLWSPKPRLWLIVAAFALCWIIALGNVIAVNNIAAHGHLLLPGLAAFGALIVAGVYALIPTRFHWRTALSVSCLMLTITLVSLFGYFRFAYEPLPPPAAIGHPLTYRNGDVAELIGSDASEYRGRPGDTVYVTIYWRANRPYKKTNLMSYLHSLDSEVVRRNSTPGSGQLAPVDWQPGLIWGERYPITIPPDAEAQRVYPVVAGLYDRKADAPLDVTDDSGQAVTSPVIGRLVVDSQSQSTSPDYRFENVIGVQEPKLTRVGSGWSVCFRWISLGRTPVDYQVFVHAIDSSNKLIAQSDSQPKSGNYPTSAWAPGDVIEDCASLTGIPAEALGWHVAAGLYDLASGQRLHVATTSGQLLPNDELIVQP